jgi:hypothetical protein
MPDDHDRARRILALPPPPQVDENGEVINPIDTNGAPDLTDVSPRYLRELARAHTRDALDTLYNIMIARGSSDTAKIAAARELLARGWGKPADEADILRVWLEANQHALEQTEDKPITFVMPMTVDFTTETQDT